MKAKSRRIEGGAIGISTVSKCKKAFVNFRSLHQCRIGVMFDTINTLNDICFIDEFDKVMTKEILNYVCNYKITNTLLKLNVLLINKRY